MQRRESEEVCMDYNRQRQRERETDKKREKEREREGERLIDRRKERK